MITYNNEIISIMASNHINNNNILEVNDIIREIIDNALCLRTLNSKFIILVLRLQFYKILSKQGKYLYVYIDIIIIIYDNDYNDKWQLISNQENIVNKCQNNILDNYYMNYDELITSNHSSTKTTPIILFPYLLNKIYTISITNRFYITNIVMNSYFITN